MALAVCVFMTWTVIITLSLIPKKLSELEMIFLYFIDTIFELSVFTIVHLNLKWISVGKGVEIPFADLVLRLIMNPLILIISSNILLYSRKFLKWIIVIALILSSILLEKILVLLGVIILNHWNVLYTIVMWSCYVLFSRLMAWLIICVGSKEVKAD